MTTQTEALINSLMEQAQVFASAWSLVGGRFDGGNAMDDAEVAKNELRQMIEKALVQPEQEPVAWGCNRYIENDKGFQIGTDEPELAWGKYAPDDNGWWPLYTSLPAQPKEPEQEPVAWLCERKDGHFDVLTDKTCVKCFPVYTTPPHRTWVGLTPQERDEINKKVYGAVPHHVAFHHAIEAKLKEKNA